MEKIKCKHCESEMTKVLIPPDSDWGVDFFWVCMNDECSYYVKGWDWMMKNFQVKASYRYKVNVYNNNEGGPMPVFSPDDLKGWVVKKFRDSDSE